MQSNFGGNNGKKSRYVEQVRRKPKPQLEKRKTMAEKVGDVEHFRPNPNPKLKKGKQVQKK